MRDVAPVHLADVQTKIADLRRMERVLKDLVHQCGDGTMPGCSLLETLFQEKCGQPISQGRNIWRKLCEVERESKQEC